MIPMNMHIVQAYDRELDQLDRSVGRMGLVVEHALSCALTVLENSYLKGTSPRRGHHLSVEEMEGEVQSHVVVMLARRQPMAIDLRHIVSAGRIATDLRYLADAITTLKRIASCAAHANPPERVTRHIGEMAQLARSQLGHALTAYRERDAEKALRVWAAQARMKILSETLIAELSDHMAGGCTNIGPCTHLLLVGTHMERIGAHSARIAGSVHYLVAANALGKLKGDAADTHS
jgi:phosphate transport system protein